MKSIDIGRRDRNLKQKPCSHLKFTEFYSIDFPMYMYHSETTYDFSAYLLEFETCFRKKNLPKEVVLKWMLIDNVNLRNFDSVCECDIRVFAKYRQVNACAHYSQPI